MFNELLPLIVISGAVIVAVLLAGLYCLRRSLDRKDIMIEMMQADRKIRRHELIKLTESYESKLKRLLERSQIEMCEKIEHYEQRLKQEIEKSRKYLSEKKSTEVRTGHILEKVAPLFEDFPVQVDSGDVFPIFGSIDYLAVIHQGDDAGVYLIEVKSGNASLSSRQKSIKKLVEGGRVFFKTFRKRGNESDNVPDAESSV